MTDPAYFHEGRRVCHNHHPQVYLSALTVRGTRSTNNPVIIFPHIRFPTCLLSCSPIFVIVWGRQVQSHILDLSELEYFHLRPRYLPDDHDDDGDGGDDDNDADKNCTQDVPYILRST